MRSPLILWGFICEEVIAEMCQRTCGKGLLVPLASLVCTFELHPVGERTNAGLFLTWI